MDVLTRRHQEERIVLEHVPVHLRLVDLDICTLLHDEVCDEQSDAADSHEYYKFIFISSLYS